MAKHVSSAFNTAKRAAFIEDFEAELLEILNDEQKYTFERAYRIPAGTSDSGETLYYEADFYAKSLNVVIELELKHPEKDEMQRYLRNALLSRNQVRMVLLSDEFLIPDVAARAICQVIRHVLLAFPGTEIHREVN